MCITCDFRNKDLITFSDMLGNCCQMLAVFQPKMCVSLYVMTKELTFSDALVGSRNSGFYSRVNRQPTPACHLTEWIQHLLLSLSTNMEEDPI